MRDAKWVLVLVAIFACGYIAGGMGFGADSGNVAHAQVVDVSYQGIEIPESIDLIMHLVPKIDGDDIRLWMTTVHRSAVGTGSETETLWSNVIVASEGGVLCGIDLNEKASGTVRLLGPTRVLGTRPYEPTVSSER